MSKSNTKSDPTSKDYAEKVRNKANENTPFEIDKSKYSNMDDWLPVENIDKVKMIK